MTRRLSTNQEGHSYRAADVPAMPYRSEEWHLAAAAGRDAARAGKPITANPFLSGRPDAKAWVAGWNCARAGEDITARYRLKPERRMSHKVDYTAEALSDFAHYATAADIPDEDRAWARDTLRQIRRRLGYPLA